MGAPRRAVRGQPCGGQVRSAWLCKTALHQQMLAAVNGGSGDGFTCKCGESLDRLICGSSRSGSQTKGDPGRCCVSML